MYITESELFKNLSKGAMEKIKSHASHHIYRANEYVFYENDEAENLYILSKGSVDLVIGEAEDICFVVDRPGEILGWSSLVEPYKYQASARCMLTTELVVVPKLAVEELSKEYPLDGIMIFRNLAGIVTRKLKDAYRNTVFETDMERIVATTNEQLQRPT